MNWPNLDDVLGDIPWAVRGAVATRLYMPERATGDLDVIIHQDHRVAALRRLEQHGFARLGDLRFGGSTWLAPNGVEIDVIERQDGWVAEALEGARTNRDVQGLPILPLPYQVLMKLQASRGQDLADLIRMLGVAPDAALAEVRSVISEYAPADLPDLQSLTELGRLEQETDASGQPS